MPKTKNLPIYGAQGIAGTGGSDCQLKVLIWEKVGNTVFFSGKATGTPSGTAPNNFYVGQVVFGIDAPVFSKFETEEQASGVVTSSLQGINPGEIYAGIGTNKIYLTCENTSPTNDLIQVSFSGSYEITSEAE